MAKGWYVLHTYSGYENKVERYIRKLMENPEVGDYVFDIKIPSEEVVEVKDGKKKTINRKFFFPDTFFWRWICLTAGGRLSALISGGSRG